MHPSRPDMLSNDDAVPQRTDSLLWSLEGLGDSAGAFRNIPIHRLPFVIGRRPDLTLCLPCPSVSKVHAEIVRVEQSLHLNDLGSTNGTFVNGRRIADRTALSQGSLINFGTMEFRVSCQTTSTGSKTMREVPGPWVMAACQFDKLFEPGISVPYFQPIVQMGDGQPVGYEVLARCLLEGLRSPYEMFSVAERLQQENELSRHFRSVGVHEGRKLPGMPSLFLNTHPHEVEDPKLLESLKQLRREAAGMPLTLEIHEAAITKTAAMKELRAALNDLDIQLAYDDFGTGRDRLLDLVEVPPDYLKFDARLIRDIDSATPARRQMLGVLIKMVRDLNIATLAEGVETKAENEVCQALGFDYCQGYFYGRPAPIEKYVSGDTGRLHV
jgi:EAL domain-containing protein (putative c-di-GMP-specific phosphodiesterase class I)